MSEAQEAAGASGQAAATTPAFLPSGLKMPNPLNTEGNLAANWKKFKRSWDNYAIVARIDRFEGEFKTAAFLSAIGEDAMEIYEGMQFEPVTRSNDLDAVIEKFTEFCIGETNETYERFNFNSRNQKEGETVDQYLTALRTLAQTCGFCVCLRDSLLRDRLVLGITDDSTRKKLLQERKLTLQLAVDMCRSGETTTLRMKNLKTSQAEEINALRNTRQTKGRQHGAHGRREAKVTPNCHYCGGEHEIKKESCPAFGKTCKSCGRNNHFAAVCKQKATRQNRVHAMTGYDSSDSGDSVMTLHLSPETDEVLAVQHPTYKPKLYATMQIKGGKETQFQIDTGATCNVIKRSELSGTKYANNVEHTTQVLTMYNSTALKPAGKCQVQLTNSKNNRKYKVNFTVVEDEDAKVNLLGSRAAQQMELLSVCYENLKTRPGHPNQMDEVNAVTPDQLGMTLQETKTEYGDVFEGLGNLGAELHLEVDESAKPVQLPPRRIPEALKQPLKEHLADLEKQGVIEKVEQPTDWVNAIVVARKSNGKIRLCLDPRPLNKHLKRCLHPIPNIEDVLPELSKAKVFTKVDCRNGYWQVKLDNESSLLTTFNTPFGRYKWNRMPFGISPAGEIFQKRLDEAIEGLEGVRTVADDILVIGCGETMEEAVKDHDKKFRSLLDRCRARSIKLNEEKVELKKTSIPYIGHLLTSEGVKADPSKTEAISKMDKPADVAGVRRIMGTVNYLAKFLPKLSEVSEPLRQLTKKDSPFVWNETHDAAFEEMKRLVTGPPLLKYYEPDKPLVLQCDASENGLGAAILQEGRPIAFASRALTRAERNYAQIEKELLAIVYGVERFHQYTYGRQVFVETDHKPLEAIHQKPLVAAPRRLQRMLMSLQRYDLLIQYKKGEEMYLADTLSRHYLESKGGDQEGAVLHVQTCCGKLEQDENLQEINQLLVTKETAARYQEETNKDESLQGVKRLIQSGWPHSKNSLPQQAASYFHIRDELGTQDGLVFRGDRLVIPKSMRREILEDLHSSHQGVESTLRRARELVYWPNLNAEVKDHISRCETCGTYGVKQQKETLMNHDVPSRPWAKIATDLLSEKGKMYLVTVDYLSNFFEIDRMYDTKAKPVIRKLKAHIARYGIPDEIVSDNGPQFESTEFQKFAAEYGFKHTRTSPHYHQANGKVEAAVKRAKKIIRRATTAGSDAYMALLDARNTPIEGYDTSPVQLLMSRRTKTKLPTSEHLLRPRVVEGIEEKIEKRQAKQRKYYNRSARDLSPLQKGDVVRMQPFKLGQKKWTKGQVTKQVGPRSYEVQSEENKYVRNRRHLRKSAETPPLVEQAPVRDEEAPIQHDDFSQEETNPEPATTMTSPMGETEPIGGATRTRSCRVSTKPARFRDYVLY